VISEWPAPSNPLDCGSPGYIELARDTGIGGTLTVKYTITGPVEPTPGVVTFTAGDELASIALTPTLDAGSASVVHFDLTAGTGYEVGDPSFTEVPVESAASCASKSAERLASTGPQLPVLWLLAGASVLICVGGALSIRSKRWAR
jgi:hypothetical protein